MNRRYSDPNTKILLFLGSTGSGVSLTASLPVHTSVSDRPQRAAALCFNASRFIYCASLCLLCACIILNRSPTSITEILIFVIKCIIFFNVLVFL